MLSIIAIPLFIIVPKTWVRVVCALVWVAGMIIQPEIIPYHLIGSVIIAGLTFLIIWLVKKYKHN